MPLTPLAQVVHDFRHPGVSNSFLTRTCDPLALRYNDESVLENFHVAEAFALMIRGGAGGRFDVLGGLAPEQRLAARFVMIKLVLATDLAPGVQLNGGDCYETLATGPPLHALQDPANAATGGIITTFAPSWTVGSDMGQCGTFDPVKGRELGRSLVLRHGCNASMAVGEVVVLGGNEAPECTYTMDLMSAAACGVPFAPSPTSGPANPLAPVEPAWAPGAGQGLGARRAALRVTDRRGRGGA